MTRSGRVLLVASLAALACARDRLTQTHGRSYQAAFARQTANPASKAQPPNGLDSQEAAIVAESYRRSLAPKGTPVNEEPVLVVTPQKREQQAPLAPSVPRPEQQ
jgi:hypothetical protein